MSSAATPDCIAARRGDRSAPSGTSGTIAHAASDIGQASADTGPSTDSRCGDVAKATPARPCENGVPMRSRPASATTPV